MVNDKTKDKLTFIAEIIGIMGGLISIISFIMSLTNINLNQSALSYIQIPSTYAYVLFVISILILVIATIRKRMNHGKTDIIKHWHFTPHKRIGERNLVGFRWDITIPDDEYNLSLENIRDNFDISPHPKCEKCGVTLDPPKDCILYYKYECFNCDFRKRKWDCLEKITDHANELFKKELDEKIYDKK